MQKTPVSHDTTSSIPLATPDANLANRDPITGASGAHPVGTGLGAAGGGAVGAAIGSLAGPIGTVAGAVIGAVAGGLGGKAAGEAIDPTVEEDYWEMNHKARPYARTTNFNQLRPAYRYGWENADRAQGKTFDESMGTLEQGWNEARGDSKLAWDAGARDAARDAWERVRPNR